ncbi:putative WD repeat-containing protein [Vanrija pseudolonga]|uniref:Purtative WD repeat-containing protein n=1 Tax=Vanrija pseudolonga TaxID=143232 RepID=A0AAF0YC90_9TREE|nr:purtative WD repeat-containing protein [Vanrija pseudolonga]
MNRFATVLYPSLPASDGPTTNVTPIESARAVSPVEPSPQLPTPLSTRSLYDDPRTTRYVPPSPLPGDDRASALRRDDSPGARSGASTPTNRIRRGPDRSLRINLMQVAASQPKSKGRRPPSVAASGRLTSLARGPGMRYVVGGGQYLRVLEITDPQTGPKSDIAEEPKPSTIRQAGSPFARGPGGSTISEIVNLWKGSWAIGKGVNDVDWGVGAFETKVVTATPSGNFMVFDINRGKLDREVLGGHPRPMNAITFCKSQQYSHLVLTGGTEGQARLWDLRDNEPTNRKYYKHNAPISALTFCPDDPHLFVAGTEAGGLFRYDYRVPNKAVGKIWGAHGSKPVFDLKWKTNGEGHVPTGQGWLASAGGDRTVQIWDMSHSWEKGATPTHALHTAYQIRCVDWRPQHPTELVVVPFNQPLASASAESPSISTTPTPMSIPLSDDIDSSLEVWDVRRHYVAKYALPGYDGNAVAAIWDDDNSIVACYQNGGLVQIDLESRVSPRTIPLETIPRQVVAWSVKNELAYAIDRFKLGEVPFDDVRPEFSGHWQVGRPQHRKGVADPPYEPLQASGTIPLDDGRDREFQYLADQYRLEGEPEAACKWNREVAKICGKEDEARLWDFLQGLIEEFSSAPEGIFNEAVFSQTTTAPVPVPVVNPPSPRRMDSRRASDYAGISLEEGEGIVASDKGSDTESSSSSSMSSGPHTPKKSRFKAFVPPTVVGKSQPPPVRPILGGRSESSATAVPTLGASYPSLLSRSMTKRLTIETPSESDTPNGGEMDYPDPYGIAAALESTMNNRASTSGGGRLTSKSTPQSTRPPSPSEKDRVPDRVVPVRLSSAAVSVVNSARPSVVAVTKDRIQPGTITRLAQGSFPSTEWELYREKRCTALLDWWRSYVEDGEAQLATTVFVVGSIVVDFPQKQAQRVLEAYLGE